MLTGTLPKLSIITPNFNQGSFLEKAILSVLNQNYTNLEYIIIDGGSTDQSVEIIKKYQNRLSYWLSEKDRGQSDAINKGLSKVTGDIVAWIGSDDWYEDNVFHQVAQEFLRHNNKIIIGNCQRHYITSGKTRLLIPGTPTFRTMTRYWRKQFCPPQPSIFFSREALEYSGPLNESLMYGMDLDLWLRMVRRYDFHYIDKLLSHYLIHDSSKSGSGTGFKKFRKEWKKVCFNHIKTASLPEKVSFYADYYYHAIRWPELISTEE